MSLHSQIYLVLVNAVKLHYASNKEPLPLRDIRPHAATYVEKNIAVHRSQSRRVELFGRVSESLPTSASIRDSSEK